jgi:hypothetical protein
LAMTPIRWALAGVGLKFGYTGWKRAARDEAIGPSGESEE